MFVIQVYAELETERSLAKKKNNCCFDVSLWGNSRPKWLGPYFSDVFFFFFFDILFVLFSANPSEKQSSAAAPAYCLWRQCLISGCFRGSCFSLFFPLLLLCIYLIWRSLFSHCSYATDLTTFFADHESQYVYIILIVASRASLFFFTASAYGLFKSMNNFSFHSQAWFCHKFPSAVLFAWFYFVALLKSIAKKIIT